MWIIANTEFGNTLAQCVCSFGCLNSLLNLYINAIVVRVYFTTWANIARDIHIIELDIILCYC